MKLEQNLSINYSPISGRKLRRLLGGYPALFSFLDLGLYIL